MLDVRGLCVDYGVGRDAVRAVTDVSFTLRRGEVLGLAGESGSGKSTLAYAITRLLRAPGVITGGEVFFHQRSAPGGPVRKVDLLEADARELAGIRWVDLSMVFQSAMHALNPVARIESQLTDVLKRHRPDMAAADRRARAVELLGMVGITADRLRAYPHELSGGMRQRVMIAMALALEPSLVLMDEPTTALDVVTQREILDELMQLRERLGFAVIFITHDLSLLLELADTIAIMYAGRLVELAAATDLAAAPRHPYSLGLLSSFPALHGERVKMTGIPGAPPSLRTMPDGCKFHPRCPHAFERCSAEEPSLLALPGSRTRRTVSCWLHVGDRVPPEALGRPDPGTDAGAGHTQDVAIGGHS
ncbi:ABC transporter ATP-binding protein [Actinospica sp. MGRD01-02]|uniref:ABC transporter ATP-binding protein n=1 Tax=Actinospica acidithermotolerans TaxID=2828514 RepID=A0A941IGD2_9ACTN|nr:ABC transporter ATP-binding protein [Actinospica acidithermotolerans]